MAQRRLSFKCNCISNHPPTFRARAGHEMPPSPGTWQGKVALHLAGTKTKLQSTCAILPASVSRKCKVRRDAGTDWARCGYFRVP